MIDVCHDTPGELAAAFVSVVQKHWTAVRKTYIADCKAKCELHNGVTVEADTPEDLNEKLAKAEAE